MARVLPRFELERMIRKAGAERVGLGAGEKLAEILEDRAGEIIEKAIRISRYAGRKTLTRKDIELACS